MNRIKVDISKAELDFIRESIQLKTKTLLQYLDVCEWPPQTQSIFEKQSVIVEKHKKPHWTHTPAGRRKLAARKRSKK
jgi:hypothetical protein